MPQACHEISGPLIEVKQLLQERSGIDDAVHFGMLNPFTYINQNLPLHQ
jgi:hypothetical protein